MSFELARFVRQAFFASLVAFAGFGMAGSRSGAQAPTADPALRQTIERIGREFPTLARAKNPDAAAAWFAPDAIIYANGMPPVRGREAIRSFYAGFFQAFPIRDMSFTTEEISQHGDVAIESGSSSLTIGAPGQANAPTVAGKYLAVWKKQRDGKWLLWRHSPSSNVMQPTASAK